MNFHELIWSVNKIFKFISYLTEQTFGCSDPFISFRAEHQPQCAALKLEFRLQLWLIKINICSLEMTVEFA